MWSRVPARATCSHGRGSIPRPGFFLPRLRISDTQKGPGPRVRRWTCSSCGCSPIWMHHALSMRGEQPARRRDIMLKLWAQAQLPMGATTPDSPATTPDSQRHTALSTMILAIAQRNEFNIEYLGFRLPSTKKAKKAKNKSIESVRSIAKTNRMPISSAGLGKSASTARGKDGVGNVSKQQKSRSLPAGSRMGVGYYEATTSDPLPQIGSFNPKLRNQLEHGHKSCQLLGLTIVYITRRTRTWKPLQQTNAARRVDVGERPPCGKVAAPSCTTTMRCVFLQVS